jgi:magnesium-transporting ATPase (P-type)
VLTFDQCEAVVFCRVSPKQKGEIVKTVLRLLSEGKKNRWSTLAIGDGANDVNMINIANVGVGISGNEGAQAANSADYAIAEFKDLHRLLFVHGRWNYRRTKDFIFMFIYKNFVCAMCIFWYATVSSFSAATLFESTYLLLFNSVFGIVPLFVFGAVDKDVDPINDGPPKDWQPPAVTASYWEEIVVPRLYRTAEKFSSKNFMKWCLVGIFHSVAPFYFTWGCWDYDAAAIDADGQVPSLWMSSILVYTAEIFLISIVTMYISASWTKLLVWSALVFNIGAYFLFVFVYDFIKLPDGQYPTTRIAGYVLGNVQFWIILLLTLMVSTGPMVWLKHLSKFRRTHKSSFTEVVMETKATRKGLKYSSETTV